MKLRAATPADIPSMVELERACPAAAHWTEKQYQQAVQPDIGDPERLVLVAEASRRVATVVEERFSGPPIVGFLVARHLAPEWELENIVVTANARGKGIGSQLLDALLARTREAQSEAVFLEVRESNTAARSLYEKAGFQQAGRRKSYYTNPAEDAILYRHSPV